MNRAVTLRTIAIATAIVFLGLAAFACGPSVTASRHTASPATATPQRVSLEGRFSFDQMQSFLDTVTPMVAEFIDAAYPGLPHPRGIVFVPHGSAVRTSCGTDDGQAYEYCLANQTIYIGQDLLWTFYSMGDAAPVVGLAHEWGHHVQALRRLPLPHTAAQSIDFEDQADCVAGAWAKYARSQGWLELPDDLNDIGGLLQAIGSREGPGRDHGTAAQRTAAFDSGFTGGLEACNSFIPQAPIA